MEKSALLLLVELKAMGHDVELLSLNELGDLAPLLAEHGIPASGLGYHGRWGWKSYLPLRRRLAKTPADALIMTGHNVMAMLALGSFCRNRRILTWHYHHRTVKHRWAWRFIYRLAASRFSAIVYPSHFIANEACEIAPEVQQMHIVLSYPFWAPEPLSDAERLKQRAAARAQFGIPADADVVGNAGWLIVRKRWDVFLEVSALVAKEVPNLRLLVAGDGPERASLEQLAAGLGIADKITWLGWQSDLEPFYHAIDVMLFNSDWDAMARSPLESMSVGIPTVVSLVNGGLGEVLGDSEAAAFYPTHDVPAMAAKVVQLLKDKQYAREMADRGRQLILETGSPRLHAERIMALLNR